MMYGTVEKSAWASMNVTRRVPLEIMLDNVGHSEKVMLEEEGEYDKVSNPTDSKTLANSAAENPSEFTMRRERTVEVL